MKLIKKYFFKIRQLIKSVGQVLGSVGIENVFGRRHFEQERGLCFIVVDCFGVKLCIVVWWFYLVHFVCGAFSFSIDSLNYALVCCWFVTMI